MDVTLTTDCHLVLLLLRDTCAIDMIEVIIHYYTYTNPALSKTELFYIYVGGCVIETTSMYMLARLQLEFHIKGRIQVSWSSTKLNDRWYFTI